ncbi:hypothetical protein DM50_2829 [Burkholderia mallei]|nr:hypothetical protein DM50_2829 [Burkholderia mallei]
MRRQSLRRNIGQPRTLLPLSRSWFKGTLLEAHWPYRRGQVSPACASPFDSIRRPHDRLCQRVLSDETAAV